MTPVQLGMMAFTGGKHLGANPFIPNGDGRWESWAVGWKAAARVDYLTKMVNAVLTPGEGVYGDEVKQVNEWNPLWVPPTS